MVFFARNQVGKFQFYIGCFHLSPLGSLFCFLLNIRISRSIFLADFFLSSFRVIKRVNFTISMEFDGKFCLLCNMSRIWLYPMKENRGNK